MKPSEFEELRKMLFRIWFTNAISFGIIICLLLAR